VKTADVFVVAAVDDGHGLQAETLHLDLWSQQKSVIQIVEKFARFVDRRFGVVGL
jgi:hypothetical protein